MSVQRSSPRGAVFLSYASQDAEAARRICEALRAAGIEVWFDLSELRGGDTWDQKIRKQIKECTLFLPVISASTQARREGYFRLEWKLAEDRTHLMARGTPFLVPVCIDDTKDWDALVPDSFMTVQWTRLPGGETPVKFCDRVGQLLVGDTEVARVSRPVSSESTGQEARVTPQVGRRVPAAAWIASAALVAVALFFALRPSPNADAGTRPPALSTSNGPIPPAAAAPSGPRDPELRRAVKLLNGSEANSEDFALAEEIANKALAKNSTDPEAVTVMARVQVSYLLRGFDRSDERRATARRYAERAVQLAPDEPEALGALGVFHIQRAGNLDLARELLEKAIRLRPDEPYFHRHRDNALFSDTRVPAAEAVAAAEATAARFPRDALSQYELARHYRDLGRIDECERAIDRTLAIEPIANAIGWKARIALNVRGNFAEMKSLLDRIPPRMRSLERVVLSRWMYAIAGTDREEGLRALQSLTNPWVEDFYYVGPKSLLQATLYEAAGKQETARSHFQAALGEIRARQARAPTDANLRNGEFWSLLGIGRTEEARAAYRFVQESVRRPYRYDPFSNWWFSTIPRALLVGERATAVELIREAVSADIANRAGRSLADDDASDALSGRAASLLNSRAAIRLAMKQDVRMAPFRDDPEIAVLLAEPKKPEEKPNLTAVPASEGAQLVARARTLYTKLNYTRDDLAVADELTRKATELEAGSAAAWGARAGIQATYIYRNWDSDEKRRQDTQAFANRALGLNPEEPEALIALGHLMNRQGVVAQAEAQFRRAVAADPANNRAARALATTLSFSGREEEGRAILLEAVRRDPRDPLVRYDLALTYDVYVGRGKVPPNLALAFEHLDAGLAAQPIATLLLAKAVAQGGWAGDLAAMRGTLEQLARLPLTERAEDRAVFVAMWGGLLERDATRVLEAATLTAKNYLEDSVVPRRPVEWSLALAHRLERKENLARLDWQRAEQRARARARALPGNNFTAIEVAIALAWLGQTAEAAREVAPIEAAWREELNPARARMLALYYAALGDAAKAAPYLRAGLNTQVFLTTQTVPRDPWFDQLRGQAEFEAVLKEFEAKR
ncbi:MAG: TIR domain-containing protein [Verrucomicrobia bacterium]|nr:TIR domain-containing protein [Verrucomicrobiota bacterium]